MFKSNVDPSRINPRSRSKVMHRFAFCEIQAIFHSVDCVVIQENRTLEHSVFQLIRTNRDCIVLSIVACRKNRANAH